MNKLEFKKLIISHCIQQLIDNGNSAKEAMDDAQNTANEYGQPRDRYDSFRAQLMRKRDMFAQQYQNCLDDISVFNRIHTSDLHDQVAFGSIVFTDHHKIFIATSLGKIKFKEENFIIISMQTPLFQTIKGLKKDDCFEFNMRKTKILEVF